MADDTDAVTAAATEPVPDVTATPIAPPVELKTGPVPESTVKPGYLTSEFWGTAFVHALALAALVSQQQLTGNHYVDGAIKACALIVAVVNQFCYNRSRTMLKAVVADIEAYQG